MLRAIPVLADGVFRLRRRVVKARVHGRVALHHVVAEARVAKVVEQKVQVSLHHGLHVWACVVKVARPAEIVAGVVCTRGLHFRLGGCLSFVVVGADVRGQHGVSHAVVSLLGKAHPRAGERRAVVDHHVGNRSNALLAERVDHRAQLLLVAEGAGVVGEPPQVVVAH